MTDLIAVTVEATSKKAFASAVDWPGWSRGGKTAELALEAPAAYAPRYAVVISQAGRALVPGVYEVVEETAGGSGTDFGVLSAITALDRRPLDDDEAARRAGLVEAAWAVFGRVASSAPADLRKGPRGGGRDRDKMIGHVIESDWYYAREIDVRVTRPDPSDPAAVAATRAATLDVLCRATEGSPPAGRKWTTRYAARRIAWHALDHAWAMEDRS